MKATPSTLQPSPVLLADERVLLVVQDGPPALVDAEQVAGFDVVVALVGDAPARVRAAPVVDHAQRIRADAEVLVEPVAATRRRRDQAARHVLQHADLVALAVLPGRRARSIGQLYV